MTPTELTSRVTAESLGAIAALALVGAWIGSVSVGVGVATGGVLALGNFRWLARQVGWLASAVPMDGGRWLAGAGLRFALLAAACAALLASGWAHPVALLVGFSVLPWAVIAQGLRAARREG